MAMCYSPVILNGRTTRSSDFVKNKVVCILSVVSGQINNNNNNNNKYNSYSVRPVLALEDRELNGWMEAYADCISNKMTSEQCTMYRLHDEDLVELIRECKERRYEPKASICFLVTKPKLREIFAADFRDRIVQHWICLRIEPLLERRFASQSNVSWNCRKGKGTQKAVGALRQDILDVSCNYTRQAWVGRFDIKSFFMSIDIRILEKYAIGFVRKYYQGGDLELLVYLLTITIRHRPQDNCVKHGDLPMWDKLPKHKSLFYVERFRGMPIGNITSQLLANFYMSFLDGYMVELCKPIGARYERFVDDFAVVCRKKEEVLMLRDKASIFLKDKLNLEMHHDKVYIQDVTKGVSFVGSVIKMQRLYLSNRTVGGLVNVLRHLQEVLDSIRNYDLWNAYELEHYLSSINSYFGFMKGKSTYAIKRRIIKEHCPSFFGYFYVKGNFVSVKLKRKYSVRYQLLILERYG